MTAAPRWSLRCASLVLWAWASVAADSSRAQAPEAPADDGVFITVSNPITSEVYNRVRNLAEEARGAKAGRVISRIIFDFNPNGRESSSPDFGPAYDLAKYIKNLHNLTTVAYVHQKATRHTVLPILACKELVMGGPETAWIGRIVDDPKKPLEPQEARAYEQFAGEARWAVVQKMFDPNVELMKGRRNNAEFYFDKRRQADAVAVGVVGGELVMPAGDLAFLNSDEAVRYGLCKLNNKPQRRQVAEAYGMSPASLRLDPLRGKSPVARALSFKGEINTSFVESMTRRINRAREDGANTFFIRFSDDFGGGNIETARALADKLRAMTNDEARPVQLVAFVPFRGPDSAIFVALGCSDIVMSEDATLGDFSDRMGLGQDPRRRANADRNLNAIKLNLRELLESTDRDPVLAEGLLDPDAELYRVRTKKGPFERRLIAGDELAKDQQIADPHWQVEQQLKHKGKAWVLDGKLAKELGVARHVVKGRELPDVYAEYGIEAQSVRELSPDWLDQISSFLRHPAVRFFLVVLGVTCLILEVKIPGATAPGVIAAVCFVLFFWAHFMAGGPIIILAALLFVLGLVLIGIEVFVLPGFGFVGVSGILLMIVGLGLATVERMPQSQSDWLNLGAQFTQFGLGMLVALFGALILARYLPNIPVANRMVLPPPSEKVDGTEDPSLPGVEQAVALLGAFGSAATDLRPAGMARFAEQYVDVVTDGSFIPAGARIQVIEVEGTRIVVKEV